MRLKKEHGFSKVHKTGSSSIITIVKMFQNVHVRMNSLILKKASPGFIEEGSDCFFEKIERYEEDTCKLYEMEHRLRLEIVQQQRRKTIVCRFMYRFERMSQEKKTSQWLKVHKWLSVSLMTNGPNHIICHFLGLQSIMRKAGFTRRSLYHACRNSKRIIINTIRVKHTRLHSSSSWQL